MKDTKWIDDLEAAVPRLREFAETLTYGSSPPCRYNLDNIADLIAVNIPDVRKALVPNVTRGFMVRVTLISPSEQEAEADLMAWIRIKNQTGTQMNGSSLTFERVEDTESWEEGPL